jgi:ribosomal protein S27AE
VSSEATKSCSVCRAPLAWADVPGYGRIWHCDFCLSGLQTEDGTLHRWQRSVTKIERRERSEQKKKSDKLCPECRQPMWEIVMPDFGPRWQCEHCRLTVFSSGGVQHWSRS